MTLLASGINYDVANLSKIYIYMIIYAFLVCLLSGRTKKNDVLIINNIYVQHIPPMKL